MSSYSNPPSPRAEVVFAASGGGHLELLADARDVVPRGLRSWVTVAGARAEGLRDEGEHVDIVPTLDRQNLAPENFWHSWQLARTLRPRLVVTSGAGVVLGFAAAARLFGARVLFVETMARVTSPSVSGRALARLATRTLVQWPELMARYPGARLCRPSLLPHVVPAVPDGGHGTFVSVGSHPQSFHRLLSAVEDATIRGLLPAPVLAQVGRSEFRSAHIETRSWISPREFRSALGQARLVIGHCGAGLLGSAIALGHRPLVLPRLAARDEHVDDHQQQLCAKLSELDLVVPIDGEISPELLARTRSTTSQRTLFEGAAGVREVLAEEIAELTAA